MKPEYITIEDTAIMLGCSTRTVSRLLARGELNKYYIGRTVRTNVENVREYMEKQIKKRN